MRELEIRIEVLKIVSNLVRKEESGTGLNHALYRLLVLSAHQILKLKYIHKIK